MPFSREPIEAFEQACQRHYVCYVVAIKGTHEFADSLAAVNQRTTIHFSDEDPNARKTTASLRIADLRSLAERGGEFDDRLAKAIIVTMYSEWDEYFRPKIAAEHLVTPHGIRSDLMGDVRLVRHCIVHAKSLVTDEHLRLKVLDWPLSEGQLKVTQPMMSKLFNQLNTEHITIDYTPR